MTRALRIAHAEWRYWLRSRLLLAAIAVFVVLLGVTAWLSAARIAAEDALRLSQQRAADAAFAAQPDRHPHRMVHYGHYVFRTPPPLAVFDPGIDAVAGQALFLEGHRRNSAAFAPAPASAGIGAFGIPHPALAYQVFVPLLLLALGHALFVRERESGTLAPLLAQGVGRGELVLGKGIALGGAALLMLLPAVFLVGTAVARGDDAVVGAMQLLLHAGYLAIWVLIVLLVGALLPRRAEVLGVLVLAWLATALVVPRLAASHAAIAAPTTAKITADLAMLQAQRDAGDGHNAADPAFDELRRRLLAEHGVERVEDLPVNFRGVVATVAETRLTEVLNATAERRMAEERAQSARLAAFAWASPALAAGIASRALAGTDMAAHHRFQREAEALRYAFVQALNRIHATQLAYADDIRRSSDADAERRTRVDAANWRVLREFTFRPAAPAERRAAALPAALVLAFWLLGLAVALRLSLRRIAP
jgi:ABC-2 type transport system permease protein